MKARYCISVVTLVVALAGCSTQPSEPVRASAPKPEPQLSQAQKRERQIARLLQAAESALARDRLLLPGYDNAYDRYASVLLLDEGNEAARLGLQAIVLRYIDMARNAAERSRFDEAETYLHRAGRILPEDQGVQTLVEQQRQALAKPAERPEAANTHGLDRGQLRAKSEALENRLAELAKQAREQGHMVLIVASTDAEGRWIYKTMREAVPGYLLRGDIQVGSPSRVEFLPPL